jgi:SAM-dependent methyltransferase
MSRTTVAYSARAREYIGLLGSMTAVHPSDRQIVDSWAAGLNGPVLDAGCGPGHWTDHLHGLGLQVRGIDLVPSFVHHARSAYPGIAFDRQSIDRIDADDATFGGVLSWFSTIHHEPSGMLVPLAEFARVLRPGGRLMLGFFTGTAIESFDHAVTRAYRWPVAAFEEQLDAVGFEVVETHERRVRDERPVGAIVAERRKQHRL